MWRRYRYRVLIAMSAQAFAQLVCSCLFDGWGGQASSLIFLSTFSFSFRMGSTVSLFSIGILVVELIYDSYPVISYYAPLVFESAGWIGRDAILMTGINGISASPSFSLALIRLAFLNTFLQFISYRPFPRGTWSISGVEDPSYFPGQSLVVVSLSPALAETE